MEVEAHIGAAKSINGHNEYIALIGFTGANFLLCS